MPQLSVINIGQAQVVLKDPHGYTEFVMEVNGGDTETAEVSNDLLQRLAPQLTAAETPSYDVDGTTIISGIQWSASHGTADIRAASTNPTGLPALNELQAASYSTGAGAVNVVATGTNLLGGQLRAAKNIANAAGTARVDFQAVAPGAPGNDISVEVVAPTGTLTISVTANKVTVQPAAGGSTAIAIANAINAHANAKLLVQAAQGIAGTINEAIAETHLQGGVGPGVNLSIDGTSALLTEVTNTQLTFDLPAGISAASRIVPLTYRCGPHVTQLSVPVVA